MKLKLRTNANSSFIQSGNFDNINKNKKMGGIDEESKFNKNRKEYTEY